MLKKLKMTAVALCAVLIGTVGIAQAEGVVQSASKDLAKGAIKGVEQELKGRDFTGSAKEVGKGLSEGIADTAPLVTSQIANQANINKKALGKVARQVTTDAVAGALGVTLHEFEEALGENGDGPLAGAMAATTERVAAAAVRGAASEIHVDFNFRPWTLLAAFAMGGLCTVLCSAAILMLYLLFQRRRAMVVEAKPPLNLIRPRPVASAG